METLIDQGCPPFGPEYASHNPMILYVVRENNPNGSFHLGIRVHKPEEAWLFESDDEAQINKFCGDYIKLYRGYDAFTITFHTVDGDLPVRITELDIRDFSNHPLAEVIFSCLKLDEYEIPK